MVVSLPLSRLCCCLLVSISATHAITIANESPAVNYRFSSGFRTANPIQNTSPSFVAAGYDLSSIGWWNQPGDAQRVKHTTLVAPLFSVNASHYPFAVGNTVEFLGRDGTLQTNTVAFRSTAWGDVSVTRYESAFTESDPLSVIRILDISSLSYTGQPAFIVGSQGNAVPGGALIGTEFATARVSGVIGQTVSFFSNTQDSSLSFKQLQSGDSGSPTLIPYKGQITLLGTVTGANGAGPIYTPTVMTGSTNALLSAYGYALRFTIYDMPSDTANTANVWTGGAGVGDFFTGANWSKGNAPGNLPVVFDAGTNGGQSVVTLNANQSLRGMLFRSNGGAAGFTFNGSGTLTMGSTGIRNEDAKTQSFNVAMALSGAQNWEAAEGNLAFDGNIANGGNLLVVQGAKNTTINGVISGAGGLAKDEAGTLTLGGANTYSGKTFLHNGVLKAGADNVFSTASTLAFDTANAGAVLDLDGRSAGLGNLQSDLDGKGRVALNGGRFRPDT